MCLGSRPRSGRAGKRPRRASQTARCDGGNGAILRRGSLRFGRRPVFPTLRRIRRTKEGVCSRGGAGRERGGRISRVTPMFSWVSSMRSRLSAGRGEACWSCCFRLSIRAPYGTAGPVRHGGFMRGLNGGRGWRRIKGGFRSLPFRASGPANVGGSTPACFFLPST